MTANDEAAEPTAVPEGESPPVPDVEALRRENERLQSEVETLKTQGGRAGGDRWRRLTVAVLVVLACVGIGRSTLVLWTHRALLSSEGWLETVGPLVEDPAVVEAVSVYAAEQIVTGLAVQDRAQEILPEKADFLAVPLTVALNRALEDLIAQAMATDEFQGLWVGMNRVVHEGALKVLRGESTRVSVSEEGVVTLNLFPLMDRVFERIGQRIGTRPGARLQVPDITNPEAPALARQELSAALGISLPADFGEVEVAQAEQLASASQLVQWFDAARVLLPLLTAVLIAAALWLSRRRRRTTLQLGAGTVVAMLILHLAVNWVNQQVVAGAPPGPGGAIAVSLAAGLTARFVPWVNGILVVGLLVAVAAYLLGRPGWLVALRHRLDEGRPARA